MYKASTSLKNRSKLVIALGALALQLNAHCSGAQADGTEPSASPVQLEHRENFSHDTYILGPGDGLEIELVDLPELSGIFVIGPDGTLYLPRLRAIYVEGLTLEELRIFLTEQFRTYVIDPQIYIRPTKYRPIRVYVGGEVKRPGYYTLSGVQLDFNDLTSSSNGSNDSNNSNSLVDSGSAGLSSGPSQRTSLAGGNSSTTLFPTVFDAIRMAEGITPYSDLSQVQVTRREALSRGGGRLRTQLNFLSLITEGDETQNIRLFDGDFVNVGQSATVLQDQLLKAGQTNLTPPFLKVYVSGRVEQSGPVTLPQGSSLVQAVDFAGGTKVLHGKVEFIRFTREGKIDRRIFAFKNDAPSGDYRNPVLMAGDVIRVRETALTKSIALIDEITAPAIGLYSAYSLFDGFSNR